MRFDDPQLVHRWRSEGQFPAIHRKVFEAASIHAEGAVLDLCSSTGLLGRRMVDELGFTCCALEGDQRAVSAGIAAGVYNATLPVLCLRITPGSLATLHDWCRGHEVRTVVARRCFPELSESVDLNDLREAFARAGIERIILEGRVASARTTHPLGRVQNEVDALAPTYSVRTGGGNIRVLQLPSLVRSA